MIVYHGSDRRIDVPLILKPNRALDFGSGFYTTLNETQANNFARKVQERLHSDNAIVNVYEVNLESMKDELKHLWFNEANEEWLDYVSDNRNGITTESYDFVFGSVANDGVFRTFAAYQAGVLSKTETIARLKLKQLYNQLTLKTNLALKYLHHITDYTL